MNIGFDAKRLYNNFTGLGNYSRTLVKNLSALYPENSYTLYTPKVKHHPETDFFISNPQIRTFIPDTYFKSFWRSFSLVNQLKKDNIDIFHGLSHEIPYGIKKLGIKSVVSIHDLIFKIYPETYAFVDRNIYNAKFRYSCEHSNVIIAISESTKRDIVKFFNIDPAKIEVVYQSCSNLFKVLKTDEEVNKIIKQYNLPSEYLLYVGSVIERKNLISLIEAYTFLPDNSKIPLVVIGKGKEYRELVKKKISELKLDKKVIWIDFLEDNNHLQAIYQKAQVFIYPSLYEGYGIPIIEAVQCHTPVITSNISSLPEAAGPAAYYVDPLNAQQIASGIEKILYDSDYKKQLIEEGYKYVSETFDEKILTDKLMSVYSRVVNGC
jgi:glycosyltransferase involved in cell wall biosynthesis